MTFTMTIGGAAVTAPSSFDVINPATEEVVASAPDCSPEQLDAAIAAAREGFKVWRQTSHADRSAALKRAAAILEKHGDELADLQTAEQGKPRGFARSEVTVAAIWLNAFADMEIPVAVNEDSALRLSTTHHVPIGVVAGISPWNFPIALSFWKVAAALRAGNSIVLKPSPFTPLTVLRMGELLRDVFPAGVLNVISGGDALGPMLTAHPGVDKISFTGSSATGRRIMASAASDLKRLTLELGGNDAAIVMPDVDVAGIGEALFWAAFRNTAQVCVAPKRIYIHDDIYDEVAAALVAMSRKAVMGNGAEPGVDLGPVQNRLQYDRVLDIIEDCRAKGYRFLTGEEGRQDGPGYFIPVTIIDNPPEDSRVVQEEPFGPVLPLLRFRELEEVIARANASDYGLAGSIWTKDTDRAQAIAARLETGTVWINESGHLSPWQAFAGRKQSGLGVENGLGGLLEFTAPQTVTVKRTPV
jgi:acyl-CoA reductase-like NAD-dependent aldehyde dehydrogenase